MNRKRAAVAVAGVLIFLRTGSAGDWTQFRGPGTNSVAVGQSLPVELSRGAIVWEADLPGRGLSGPIVQGDSVIVTASSGYDDDRLHILCFRVGDGTKAWERQFQATGRTVTHAKMCVATPTPATDGERIFAFYSSNDLICTDLQGRLQWYRGLGQEYPNASNSLGMSSSPVVIDGTVVVQVESDAEAFAMGVDAVTGRTRWKIDRPRRATWTSPAILPAAGPRPAQVLLQSSAGLAAVDPHTGQQQWTFGPGASTIPSVTVSGDRIVVPSNGLTVLQPSADGTSVTVLQKVRGARPSTPSPVVLGDVMLTVNGAGVLSANSLTTGKRLWQLRLRGRFSSTPVAAGGHLFCFSEQGMATVVRVTPDQGEIVSELDLGETILSSPAAAGQALYVRSDARLWKFAESR